VKDEIRIAGIDDASFDFSSKEVLVVCAVMRGRNILEGVLSTHVTKDGMDATDRIAEMVNNSKHREQIRVMMLDGITFAGFNIVDIDELYIKTEIPIIAITRKIPDLKSIKNALKNLDEAKKRWEIVKKTGALYEHRVSKGKNPIRFQMRGMSMKIAQDVIEKTIYRASVPEPIRIAHLIATGISRGESTGRV